MEFLKWCTMLMALYVAFPVYAACPPGVQETVIFYINGVDNTEKKANDAATALENALKTHPDYNSECMKVTTAYNHDELFKGDIVENVLLKAEDFLGIPFSDVMAVLYRVPPSTISGPAILAFDDAIRETYNRNAGTVDLVQRDEHIEEYYRPVLGAGKQVILVSHSQGGFYANLEWEALTSAEQENTHIVTVVTPSDHVSDGGEERNTRLAEDLIALFTFPIALAANTENDEPCGDSAWQCHGMQETYLKGTKSRTKIVNDIVAFLPSSPSEPEAAIFNNFGPGDTYETFRGLALIVGDPFWGDIDQGHAFTPIGDDYRLDRIELAVRFNSGTNELDVWLMSDSSGAPGAILEAFHFSDEMAPFSTSTPPLLAQSVLRPILRDGIKYWLIASVTGPDANASWHINSMSDKGPLACRRTPLSSICPPNIGEWRINPLVERGAFRITGTPVP